jgi:hypothetical protein
MKLVPIGAVTKPLKFDGRAKAHYVTNYSICSRKHVFHSHGARKKIDQHIGAIDAQLAERVSRADGAINAIRVR